MYQKKGVPLSIIDIRMNCGEYASCETYSMVLGEKLVQVEGLA